jgi:hypothetical protein
MDCQTHIASRRGGFGRLGGRRLLGSTLAVLVALVAVLYGLRFHADVDLYQSAWTEADYLHKQKQLGYNVYGRIEGPPRWPARAIARVDSGKLGGIEFAAPSGQKHVYNNFPGDVQFKAVTFAPEKGNRRFVVVLGRPTAQD